MSGQVAPFRGRELNALFAGQKKLAVITFNKDRSQYVEARQHWHLDTLAAYFFRDSKGMNIAVAFPEEMDHLLKFRDLLVNRDQYTRREYQMRMGILLGYSNEDILSFLKTDIAKTCSCALCGGEEHKEKPCSNHASKSTTP